VFSELQKDLELDQEELFEKTDEDNDINQRAEEEAKKVLEKVQEESKNEVYKMNQEMWQRIESQASQAIFDFEKQGKGEGQLNQSKASKKNKQK